MTLSIAVWPVSPDQDAKAMGLAERLSIPLVQKETSEFAFLLVCSNDGLVLKQTGEKAPGPIMASFTDGSFTYRLKHGGGRNQALARAVGLKKDRQPKVIDATAGLGRDGFILAYLGCYVQMIERSPIIAALLEDGLQRAELQEQTAQIVRSRLRFFQADSLEFLQKLSNAERPEVIYLDPMYPERTKSSLVKKEMRILRGVTGDNQDGSELLHVSLASARNRVVVKRPRLSSPLNSMTPSHAISGKSSRFDVYLI